jgi:hypothetical protein
MSNLPFDVASRADLVNFGAVFMNLQEFAHA